MSLFHHSSAAKTQHARSIGAHNNLTSKRIKPVRPVIANAAQGKAPSGVSLHRRTKKKAP